MFSKHYKSIRETILSIAPKNLGNPLDPKLDDRIISEVIENYRIHPSISAMKKRDKNEIIFEFSEATTKVINKIK